MTSVAVGQGEVQVAIAAMDFVARVITLSVPDDQGPEPPVTLSYQDWHDCLNRLAEGFGHLRTREELDRRGLH